MCRIDFPRLLERWDDLARTAGSLKRGYGTASLFISRLQSYPRQGQLTRLLQEYGRLIKTIFVLRYLEDEALRHHIRAQLNKGEKLYDLRKLLFFARKGVVSQQYEEGQTNCYQGSSKGFTHSLIQGEVWAGYILHHTSY